MMPFVDAFIVRERFDAVTLCRNDSFGLPAIKFVPQAVCIKDLVARHGTEIETFDQLIDPGYLAALAGQKLEVNQVS